MTRAEPRPSTDVVVVGAGLAGLVAARRLEERGATVAVVEAAERVGGRTWSEPLGEVIVDRGGQWLGPLHDRTLALVSRLGLELFPTFAAGDRLVDTGRGLRRYSGQVPPLGAGPFVALVRAVAGMEARRRLLRLRLPVTPRWLARRWDRRTLAEVLDDALGAGEARVLFDTIVRLSFEGEAEELSWLHYLLYLQSHGGFFPLTGTEGGAQQDRIVGGAQGIARGIADALEGPVFLGAPVAEIEQGDEVVCVRRAVGSEHTARFAVVAVPPVPMRHIRFEPGLPAHRRALTARLRMGRTFKYHFVYERPFWRDDGLSGEALLGTGPVNGVYDDSPADGARGTLLAFVRGREADRFRALSPMMRLAEVEHALVRCFGARARKPTHRLETDWPSVPHVEGAHALFGRGLWTLDADLARPVGRLVFAGTETSLAFHGYMEGAVRSGERAASTILRRL